MGPMRTRFPYPIQRRLLMTRAHGNSMRPLFPVSQKGSFMKYQTLFFCCAFAFGGNIGAVAQAAKSTIAVVATPATLQVPAPEAQLIMIRNTLLALTQANSTNNYTVLSALGSPTFRTSNPPTRLAQVFEPFRANNIDLAPVALVVPQATHAPRIENGRLRMAGLFPTAPMRVTYDLMYEPVGGVWRLFGLSVNLNQAATKVTPVPAPTQPKK
jgi:hypothetical protein